MRTLRKTLVPWLLQMPHPKVTMPPSKRAEELHREVLLGIAGRSTDEAGRAADELRNMAADTEALAGITWRQQDNGDWMLEVHRDGWDIEVTVGSEAAFYAVRVKP